ncbi:UNVERIFIED_CONTAM: hypothetical protein K2H54_033891 [Gekko kuhli]
MLENLDSVGLTSTAASPLHTEGYWCCEDFDIEWPFSRWLRGAGTILSRADDDAELTEDALDRLFPKDASGSEASGAANAFSHKATFSRADLPSLAQGVRALQALQYNVS